MMLMMVTSLDDQDSGNFTCSTWQLCVNAVGAISVCHLGYCMNNISSSRGRYADSTH